MIIQDQIHHVTGDGAFAWDLWAGARGVQLAELAMLSSKEGRRVEVPELTR